MGFPPARWREWRRLSSAETLTTIADIEYMAFPRLAGIAEIGWSPKGTHAWGAYRERLAAQAPRWEALGINFYRAPEVPWPAAPQWVRVTLVRPAGLSGSRLRRSASAAASC